MFNVLRRAVLVTAVLGVAVAAHAFSDFGQINAEVPRGNPQISGWATSVVSVTVGPIDYADPGLGLAAFGLPTDVLGASGSPFSLGDGGSITLGFDQPFEDGPGEDFVVFENGFVWSGIMFAELGFVEVSSDGVVFARMPAISRVGAPLGPWDGITSDQVYNLAGNFEGGTAFDLQDLILAGDSAVLSGAVDLSAVRYVRIVDVVGDYLNATTVDHFGAAVSDPYPTAFASGGFDLTGVAIMNPPGAVATAATSMGRIKSLYQD